MATRHSTRVSERAVPTHPLVRGDVTASRKVRPPRGRAAAPYARKPDPDLAAALAPLFDIIDGCVPNDQGSQAQEAEDTDSSNEEFPELPLDESCASQPLIDTHFRITKVANLTPRLDVRKGQGVENPTGEVWVTPLAIKATKKRTKSRGTQAMDILLTCHEPPVSVLESFDAVPDCYEEANSQPNTNRSVRAEVATGLLDVLSAGPQLSWLQHTTRQN